jgi:hypothetical protein
MIVCCIHAGPGFMVQGCLGCFRLRIYVCMYIYGSGFMVQDGSGWFRV